MPTNGTWDNIFLHPLDITTHCVGPGGGALVVFARVCTDRAGEVVVNVATVSVAIVPIFEPLDWGEWLTCRAREGLAAATAATIVDATAAAVISASTTIVIVAATAAKPLDLLLAVTATATARVASLTLLVLLGLDHAGGGGGGGGV